MAPELLPYVFDRFRQGDASVTRAHGGQHRIADRWSPDFLIDDEADAREIVSIALAECGARTLAVASAREAVQQIQEFGSDVMVTDIAMPREEGYSLGRKIRSMKSDAASVPVVALTAFTQPEDRRRAMRAGFKHFVPKPVEIRARGCR